MRYAGASRKSPNDAPWETLSLRPSRPISAPVLTAVQGTCRVPAPLLTAVQGTCRVPAPLLTACHGDTKKKKTASPAPRWTIPPFGGLVS